MDKETKRRFRLMILGVLGMVILMTSASFALFSTSLAGNKKQNVNTGCLKIVMSDSGNLSLTEDYPMTDEEGLKRTPYTYTIENTCTVDAYYDTTLNVMNSSNVDNLNKVKVALDGDSYLEPTIEGTLPSAELLDEEVRGVIKTYKLDEGYLIAGQKKTFELRTWIDYDVESITGQIENKVIINSVANDTEAVVYNTNTAGYYTARKNNILKKQNYALAPSSNGMVRNKISNGTVYNFRGNPNNYLTYGSDANGVGIKWRVLSTNIDGSINIITENIIGKSTYENVDKVLNDFYNSNLIDEETYIKTDSTFCKEGESDNTYIAKIRTENHNPSAECQGVTVTKIGLPTVDDLMYAGSIYNEVTNVFINNENNFLTNSKESSNKVYAYTQNGINAVDTKVSTGVKAVITLKASTKLSGMGTETNPFYVAGTYEKESTNKTDTVKPTISSVKVETNTNTRKSIQIEASDNIKIAGYYVTSMNKEPSLTSSGWEASTSTKYQTINKYGSGTYYVFVKDSSGNISDPKEVIINK